ncbi:hypothetical protein ACLOJK_031105 [Asimina triloba]
MGSDSETEKSQKEKKKMSALAPIAKPLAGKKLCKRTYKLVRRASETKCLKRGVKEVVKSIRRGHKGLCVIAGNISPIDVITHVPILCEEADVPYIYVPSKEDLAAAGATKRPTCCVLVLTKPTKGEVTAEDQEKLEADYAVVVSDTDSIHRYPDLRDGGGKLWHCYSSHASSFTPAPSPSPVPLPLTSRPSPSAVFIPCLSALSLCHLHPPPLRLNAVVLSLYLFTPSLSGAPSAVAYRRVLNGVVVLSGGVPSLSLRRPVVPSFSLRRPVVVLPFRSSSLSSISTAAVDFLYSPLSSSATVDRDFCRPFSSAAVVDFPYSPSPPSRQGLPSLYSRTAQLCLAGCSTLPPATCLLCLAACCYLNAASIILQFTGEPEFREPKLHPYFSSRWSSAMLTLGLLPLSSFSFLSRQLFYFLAAACLKFLLLSSSVMLNRFKVATCLDKTISSYCKSHCHLFCSSGSTNLDSGGSDSSNEWEKILRPFDLEELRKSFNQITPQRLCSLLELPLDVPTSMEIFDWAGRQRGYSHSFNAYYAVINKLGEAGEFKVVNRLLGQMKEEGIVFREYLFIMIMKWYGRASLPGHATRLLDEMKDEFNCKPTFKSYNVVLDILVSGNCQSIVPTIFYSMMNKGISPTVFTFSIVMKALCYLKEVDSACSLLREMTKHGCVPNSVVYQNLIHALCKEGNMNEALKLLEEMFLMRCLPDANTYTDVIHGLCKLGHIYEALKLVDRMLLHGCTPTAATYGVLVHGLCKNGREDDAKAILDKVPNPNVVLFNTLIHGYMAKGRFSDARSVLYESMLPSGCVPDVFTYTIIICGLCKAGRMGPALELLNEMLTKGCSPDIITYTLLIDGFCKKGQLKEANEIVEEMSRRGLHLNVVGYNCLICALCRDCKLNDAIEMLHQMSAEGCKPDISTFNSLIHGFCKSDRLEEAMKVYHDLLLEGVVANNVTFNTLIHAFSRKGAWEEAMELVNEMTFRGYTLDIITYNGLLKALCNDGSVEKALGLFEEMMRKGVTPNNISYNILVNGLCKAGKIHSALELLKEMLHRGLIPDIVMYNSLINGMCKMGRIREALNLFDRLHVEGVLPDTITYNTLISWHCKEGMLDDAIFLLDKGVNDGITPNFRTWNILVGNFVKQPV